MMLLLMCDGSVAMLRLCLQLLKWCVQDHADMYVLVKAIFVFPV